MISYVVVSFVGALSGAMAISLALYSQLIDRRVTNKVMPLVLYIVGSILLLFNIEFVLVDTGFWRYVKLVFYVSIIMIETAIGLSIYHGGEI